MHLPKGIFDYLLSKEVTAEHSRMESILHHTVGEGVDVLEVPIIGHPVTTEEVSVKQKINRNTQKYVSNEKTHEDMCMNNI